MTPLQIKLVKTSWEQVMPIAEQAAALFYGRLFDLDPSLKPLFKTDITEQGRKLMAMLNSVVNGLEQLDTLVPAVQDLGRRHAGYGVQDRHYDTVAEALLWTLGQGLGPAYTKDVEGAWVAAYTVLAHTMKTAAKAPLST